MRPAVGLANNGDFSKMAGPFGLGPEDGSWETREEFAEFIYRFTKADRFNYNGRFATAEFLSSEFFSLKPREGCKNSFTPGRDLIFAGWRRRRRAFSFRHRHLDLCAALAVENSGGPVRGFHLDRRRVCAVSEFFLHGHPALIFLVLCVGWPRCIL